jgi:hypothetical protein
MSWPTVRRWALLFALLLLTAPAFANSITIGSLTFLGSGDPNNPHKTLFSLQLNTQGLTFDNHIPGMPYSLVFDVQVYGWDAGLFTTIPATNTYLFLPHFCPCEAAVFNMTLQGTWPFRLANGQLFTPSPTLTVNLYALPGQTYLQPGQSIAIVLNSQPSPVPEPASLLLFGNGLLAIAGVVWRKRRR